MLAEAKQVRVDYDYSFFSSTTMSKVAENNKISVFRCVSASLC